MECGCLGLPGVRDGTAFSTTLGLFGLVEGIQTSDAARLQRFSAWFWVPAAAMRYVHENAPRGDLDAVLQAVEEFAQQELWLKILGGSKARILRSSLRPGDRVLEHLGSGPEAFT